jgi:alkanesulfonate monooxygenase SsuD/methylene tetrahydromethanopterin reductase-like flavin-dependent oxidoreductase (luciferase family)
MKFGVFYEWPNPETGDWKRLFEEGLEQIQYAEEMGFDFVLIAEHHFSNYGMSPAPLMQALAIAQRTRRIRIATAVVVVPVWDPLRLAEEIAVLDNLTDGRFILGVGRGYQPHELSRFDVSLEDSRGRFLECLDVLRLAWERDTSFTYDGEHVKIRHETVVWPKPRQRPHPPMWVAGTSADTLQLAAERDITPLTSGFAGPDAINKMVQSLLEEKRRFGKPTDTWELGAQTICLVADSVDEARASVPYARWQNRAGRALTRLAVTDGRVDPAPYPNEPDDEGFWDSIYYGDVDRVKGKYRRLADAGATFASCWMMVGGIEHEKIMKSIRLMGEHILPELHAYHPVVTFAAGDAPNAAVPAATQAPSG